jgi:hypothetical protein
MTNRPPPVPPANRSPKGTGGATEPDLDNTPNGRPSNLKEQDRQGNTAQNTTHQGYQQDR